MSFGNSRISGFMVTDGETIHYMVRIDSEGKAKRVLFEDLPPNFPIKFSINDYFEVAGLLEEGQMIGLIPYYWYGGNVFKIDLGVDELESGPTPHHTEDS